MEIKVYNNKNIFVLKKRFSLKPKLQICITNMLYVLQYISAQPNLLKTKFENTNKF